MQERGGESRKGKKMVDAQRKKMTQRGKRWCTEEEDGADKERRWCREEGDGGEMVREEEDGAEKRRREHRRKEDGAQKGGGGGGGMIGISTNERGRDPPT